jgi:hypothetical protein
MKPCFFAMGLFLMTITSYAQVLLGYAPRFQLELSQYTADLDTAFATTPVHPADAGFLTGSTSVQPDSYMNAGLRLGIIGYATSGYVRLGMGCDAAFNTLGGLDSEREGMYDTRQQVSDTRPAGSGSFVFSQVTPSYWTIMPCLEASVGNFESITFTLGIGFPFMEWEAKSGHDRFGSWQTVQDDSWTGVGTRFYLAGNFNLDDNMAFSLGGYTEKYSPGFGDVEGKGAYLSVTIPF